MCAVCCSPYAPRCYCSRCRLRGANLRPRTTGERSYIVCALLLNATGGCTKGSGVQGLLFRTYTVTATSLTCAPADCGHGRRSLLPLSRQDPPPRSIGQLRHHPIFSLPRPACGSQLLVMARVWLDLTSLTGNVRPATGTASFCSQCRMHV